MSHNAQNSRSPIKQRSLYMARTRLLFEVSRFICLCDFLFALVISLLLGQQSFFTSAIITIIFQALFATFGELARMKIESSDLTCL
jgi:hypothetical protein